MVYSGILTGIMARLLTVTALSLIAGIVSLSQSAHVPARLQSSPTLIVRDAGTWKSVENGIEYRRMALERSEPSYSIELKLIRFDTSRIVPRVLRSSTFQLKGANVKTFAEKAGAVAAINANYFDTDGKPLAFLKSSSQAVNTRVSKSSLYSGVFGVKDQKPVITHRDDFKPEDADEALQSGPLLILGGTAQPVVGVPNRVSRRSLIGTDQDQRLVIAVTDGLIGGLYWAEIQEIFAAPAWQIRASNLLNLDGGGSTQLYLKAGKLEELVPGTSDVPVAIGFFRKG
jgi:hypothetical protein